MSDEANLFEFPCTFPIKVMGESDQDLDIFVREVLEKHVKDKSTIHITVRDSAAGNFISVTAKFTADSKAQLDKIYEAFSGSDKVKMVL